MELEPEPWLINSDYIDVSDAYATQLCGVNAVLFEIYVTHDAKLLVVFCYVILCFEVSLNHSIKMDKYRIANIYQKLSFTDFTYFHLFLP